jgi:hypothetical protein
MMYGRQGKFALSYPADSGKPSRNVFDYSGANQKRKFQGPIPKGRYWVNPDELWERPWYRPGDKVGWGEYRITIHPYPDTVTHGRGGFFIHGGKNRGSAGCIDLTAHMDGFVDDLKSAAGKDANCYIPLTVEYGGQE